MFTPPPSPLPKLRDAGPRTNMALVQHSSKSLPTFPNDAKQATARRTRWAVLLIPLTIIFITASTRFFLHPVAFDVFSQAPTWDRLVSTGVNWTPHKRHPLPEPQAASTSATPTNVTNTTPTTTPSPTVTGSGPVPTVPSSPPDLPTPFPQPFDSDLSQNFSSISCFNFFSNMTNTQAFRACRPFSMLLQSSSAFLDAQQNLTLLNSVIWGTCNTNIAQDQCTANMAWFASALKTACAQDLEDGNTMSVETLTSLQAFDLMRDVGCISDPTTNTYCYLNAANNPTPNDVYFYSLGLGIAVPKTATPTCSACTRSVMGAYAAAIDDPAQEPQLTGLHKAYTAAASLAVQQCGTGYAQTTVANGAEALEWRTSRWLGGVLLFITWTLLLDLS